MAASGSAASGSAASGSSDPIPGSAESRAAAAEAEAKRLRDELTAANERLAAVALGKAQVLVIPHRQEEEEEDDILASAGRAVGDATKFVGGAALGGVGLVTDTIGLTKNAEEKLTVTAEGAVDLVGHGLHGVVSTIDEGLDRTAHDFQKKGVLTSIGDGLFDGVDLVSGFFTDAVHGVAGGVKDTLDWVAGNEEDDEGSALPTHKVAVIVAQLIGEERSLGLRLENRVVTAFTKPEAQGIGWKLGDCIFGVGNQPVNTQEELLALIAPAKEALKTSGQPIRFLVERLGPRPDPEQGASSGAPPRAAAHAPGTRIFVNGRVARVQAQNPDGTVTVRYEDDGSVDTVAPRTR